MHTQKAWCAGVDAYDGYDLLVAKKNQPGVRQDLLDFFEDKALDQGEWEYHKTVQKGHGRLEIRKHWIIDDPEYMAYLDPKGRWKGLRAIGMVQSERRIGQHVTQETRYYLLSFARKVELFARAVRSRLRH